MKNYYRLLLLSICLSSTTGVAQLTTLWTTFYQHTQTAGFSNENKKSVFDSSGNIYLLNDVTSNIDQSGNITAQTFHYTTLSKYDVTGQLVGSRNVFVTNHQQNGPNLIGGFGLELDALGNIFIGYVNYNSISGYNANIAKYDSDLVRLWIYNFNPSGDEQGVGLKVTNSGVAFGLVKSDNSGVIQYHIVKGDSGVSNSIPFYSFDSGTEVISDFIIDTNDEIFATGSAFVSGAKNALTMSIKNIGTLRWKRLYNGGTIIRDDNGRRIIFGPTNEVYVVGSSDRGAPNLNDAMVMKYYKSNGRFEWVTFLDNNTGNDFGTNIHALDQYNLYFSSTSGNNFVLLDRLDSRTGLHTGRKIYEPIPLEPHNSVNGITVSDFEVSPNKNAFLTGTVMATDVNGNPFSAYYFLKLNPVTGRRPIDQVFKVDFEVPVDGTFQNSYTSGGFCLNYPGVEMYLILDAFENYTTHTNEKVQIVGYEAPPIMRINNSVMSEPFVFSTYPNPAKNYLNISPAGLIESLQVTDITGKVVIAFKNRFTNNGSIDVSKLVQGIYFVKIIDNSGGEFNIRFLKQ